LTDGDDPVVNNHLAVDEAAQTPSQFPINNTAFVSQAFTSATSNDSDTVTLFSVLGMTLQPNGNAAVQPGAIITYDHFLTNAGQQTDRYIISFPGGDEGWVQTLQILDGGTILATLNAGQSFTIPLANAVEPQDSLTLRHTIGVPLGAASGVIDTTIITATSVTAPNYKRTVTDVTMVDSGCIEGTLFFDADNDGIHDSEETVYPGALMTLSQSGVTITQITTDANGEYSLSGLPSGQYVLTLDESSLPNGVPLYISPTSPQQTVDILISPTCTVANFNLVMVEANIDAIGTAASGDTGTSIQALPGETVTLTLTITNTNEIDLTNVVVTNPLNGLLNFVSASGAPFTHNAGTNVVTFDVGTIPADPTAAKGVDVAMRRDKPSDRFGAPRQQVNVVVLTITTTVSSDVTVNTTISNIATMSFDQGPDQDSPEVLINVVQPTATPTATITFTPSTTLTPQPTFTLTATPTLFAAATVSSSTTTSGGTIFGGAVTELPTTGYRPLPTLSLWSRLDLSGFEIALLLLAVVTILASLGWGLTQWLAEHRSDRLAKWFPNRPSRRLVYSVVALTVISSIIASLILVSGLSNELSEEEAEIPITLSDFDDSEFRDQLPITWDEEASTEPGLAFGRPDVPATRLIIPRLGVDESIVDMPITGNSWDVTSIYDEIGHLEGTAHPGTTGNAVLAGHVQHAKGLGPFRNLSQLRPGDLVVAEGEGVQYVYIITTIQEVQPSAIQVAYPSNQPLLTLISCSGWDNESWSYRTRVVVTAQFNSWRTADQEPEVATSGWKRYELGDKAVQLEGEWHELESVFTSENSYYYSDDEEAAISLEFEGDKVRLQYLSFWNFGIFDVYIDGEKVATIDSYKPQSLVGSSQTFFLEPGKHTLRIVGTGQANPASADSLLSLDAIDVYTTDIPQS
jgi:LPXTG-site transpeptidase (sortase) family protein